MKITPPSQSLALYSRYNTGQFFLITYRFNLSLTPPIVYPGPAPTISWEFSKCGNNGTFMVDGTLELTSSFDTPGSYFDYSRNPNCVTNTSDDQNVGTLIIKSRGSKQGDLGIPIRCILLYSVDSFSSPGPPGYFTIDNTNGKPGLLIGIVYRNTTFPYYFHIGQENINQYLDETDSRTRMAWNYGYCTSQQGMGTIQMDTFLTIINSDGAPASDYVTLTDVIPCAQDNQVRAKLTINNYNTNKKLQYIQIENRNDFQKGYFADLPWQVSIQNNSTIPVTIYWKALMRDLITYTDNVRYLESNTGTILTLVKAGF